MIDTDTIAKLAHNWGAEVGYYVKDCPPEARVITGRMIADGQFYYFERDSGLELELNEDFSKITGYKILDEKKFIWFKLRWS